MSNIFDLNKGNDDDMYEKINIDELYEKKRTQDLNKLKLFQKILARVHKRIKSVSQQKSENTMCWFVVPEHIIGMSKFDNPGCIAYLMDTLEKNKFLVKYYHPNAISIGWHHWVPLYVRDEYKKRTGITVDELGQQVEEETDQDEELDYNTKANAETKLKKDKRTYTPVDSYRQMGSIAYKQGQQQQQQNNY